MSENLNSNSVKHLYRSQSDRMIAGVCGGMAEYFSIDPVLMRILWIIITLFGGVGLLLYIAAVIIIPNNSGQVFAEDVTKIHREDKKLFWGSLFILFGLGLILRQVGFFHYFSMWHIPWQLIWAILLIGLGVYLMINRSSKKPLQQPSDVSVEDEDNSTQERQIYRSRENKMVSGVCAGLAEYFNMDATIVRLIYILLSLASVGVGLLAYIAMAFIFPEKPYDMDSPQQEGL